ncbi:MAG: C_GCAxxG_C_C family protein [Deltaproteobacteria bacterium]|nr:C_GCAxxG_C_C family protein [Deltaproteobacteria bacterium]
MDTKSFVKDSVKKYFWEHDLNCATTTLKVLAERFEINLNDQVINAALGMHGAGRYGAQCGLVEGSLMFLGIFGRTNGIADDNIVKLCREFAQQFENQFKSLQCNILRPGGFQPDDPPHLCENLTCEANQFSIEFINKFLCS